MKEKYSMFRAEEEQEILDAQNRICGKVRRIRSLALLEKLEDMISRIYRRGAR